MATSGGFAPAHFFDAWFPFNIKLSQFVRFGGRLALGLSYAGFLGSFSSSTILCCNFAFCS